MGHIERRKVEVARRKSLWPTLVLSALGLAVLCGLVYFSKPIGLIVFLFLIIFWGICFLVTSLLVSKKKAIILSLLITFFLFLRTIGIGNFINAFLLIGIAIAVNYFTNEKN